MTQHIRAAQAFAATTSIQTQAASDGLQDLRNFHFRTCKALGGPTRGTLSYGSVVSINSAANYDMTYLDPVWAAIVAAGTSTSDLQYSGTTAEATETAVSAIQANPNDGARRQVVLAFGDSLRDGTTGSADYLDLSQTKNQAWSFGIDPATGPVDYVNAGDVARVQSRIWNDPRSRAICDFSHPGWRFQNYPGGNYAGGSPWNDNLEQANNFVLLPGQQLVISSELGSNDFAYAETGTTPIGSVPQGTPGYTYNTFVTDYFTNGMIPFIQYWKTRYPGCKIHIQGLCARTASVPLNGKFAEAAQYAIANMAALGIDVFTDVRQVPALDPRNINASANRTYYQADLTHRTPAGYHAIDPADMVAYNYLAGIPVPSQYASLVVHP